MIKDKSTMHPVQLDIIATLGKIQKAKFSELNTNNISNDWFSFHIKTLVKQELIIKENNYYSLTDKGKILFLNINNQDKSIFKSPHLSSIILYKKNDLFLIQKRLIEPFYGYYEFMTCRIKWGCNLVEDVTESFKKETGLNGNIHLLGIDHKIDLIEKETILEDKYFLVFEVKDVKGTFKEKFEDGENLFLTKEEILKTDKIHFDMTNIFKLLENKDSHISLYEISDIVKEF